MRTSLFVLVAVAVLAVAAAASGPPLVGQSYKFTTLAYPEAISTEAAAVNNDGVVVGRWTDVAGVAHGFVFAQGFYQSFDVPGASGTYPADINDNGMIVGSYSGEPKLVPDGTGHLISVCCESFGFLRTTDGQFLTVDHPNPNSQLPVTWLSGINNAGETVGGYNEFELAIPNTSSHGIHSFLFDGSGFTAIDFPSGSNRVHIPVTYADDINDNGDIVGGYNDDTLYQNRHGFVLQDGMYTTLDMPGSSLSEIFGINNLGEMVGEAPVCESYAFLYDSRRGFR